MGCCLSEMAMVRVLCVMMILFFLLASQVTFVWVDWVVGVCLVEWLEVTEMGLCH